MAPSLRDLLSFAANLAAQLPLFLFRSDLGHVSPYEPLSGAPSCPLDGPMSCHNSTPVAGDSCCFVHPGGRLILAQIWDSDVRADGDEEDWSLHGLWYAMTSHLVTSALAQDVHTTGNIKKKGR